MNVDENKVEEPGAESPEPMEARGVPAEPQHEDGDPEAASSDEGASAEAEASASESASHSDEPQESQDSDSDELSASGDAGPEEEPEDAEAHASADPEPPTPPAVPPEEEHRSLKRHHVAPAMIALDRIDEDRTYQLRDEGDLSQLATDIARLGQLFPVDIRLKPPDRFQVICGFRRVAALRFLQRDRVLARLHTDLTDEDALLMALVSAIHAQPVTAEELTEIRGRLLGEGRLSPAIRSMLDKALSPGDDLAPETVGEQEIDADELANDVTTRLGEINQDLSLLADAFDSLDREKQDQLLEQLRYSSDLVTFLEGRR